MLSKLADIAEALRDPMCDLSVAITDALMTLPLGPDLDAIADWTQPCQERLDRLIEAIDLLVHLADYLDSIA